MSYAASPLRILLLSTPVAPLGSGGGGGVELTLLNLVRYLTRKGHMVEVTAPEGSVLPDATSLYTVKGELQPPAQHQSRQAVASGADHLVLTNMCRFAKENQGRFDLIVSFAYDWLPIYLTPGFETPVLHFISMCSINDAMDYEITRLAAIKENIFGCYSNVQAKTFPDPGLFRVLGFGLDLSLYDYCPEPNDYLVWTGRISPEKGLEDAVQAAQAANYPLKIVGRIDDAAYRDTIISRFPSADIEFTGFLSTRHMQAIVREAKAMIMTPHWIEAFGIVALEALACGVPVVSYNQGGPSEIIKDGETGFLVPAGDWKRLSETIHQLTAISRKKCRGETESTYTLEKWGLKMETWFLEAAGRL